MKTKKILVTAEAFGYGPIITCLNIIKELREKVAGEYIFLGSGVAFEQAYKCNFFDEYIQCDTFNRKDLEKYRKLFESVDFILSSENMEGAKYAVDLGVKVFYVDNLFWMWDEIPKQLYETDLYFISESLDMSRNITKIGEKIKNKVIVGPLRDFYKKSNDEKLKNQVLINFGGAESFLIGHDTIIQYYYKVLERILKNIKDVGIEYEDIIVCGGSRLISQLKKKFQLNNKLIFESYSQSEYLHKLYESRYVILSPGLGNYFETLNLNQRVLFIPPINYSQYWQLNKYSRLNLGYDTINWNEFQWFKPIKRYVEEDEGVNQVLSNVKQFIYNEEAIEPFNKKVKLYFNAAQNSFGRARLQQVKSYRPEGIVEVVENIRRVVEV